MLSTTENTECGPADPRGITRRIIGAALKVHRRLGPGLLESVYEKCLALEFINFRLRFDCQAPIAVRYDGVVIDCGYRVDFIVERKVIVEIKSIQAFAPIHLAQVLTYMKLSEIHCGLLINFNVKYLPDGIKRLAL